MSSSASSSHLHFSQPCAVSKSLKHLHPESDCQSLSTYCKASSKYSQVNPILQKHYALGCSLFSLFQILRVSEFTTPNLTDYDPSVHLSLQDVSIDNRENSSVLKINIKQSKTDPFRQGVQIYLGATNSDICPIFGILPYLARRGSQPEPLFLTENGQGFTRQSFCSTLNSVLSQLLVNTSLYNSFRIEAATTAAKANIPDVYIKMLGRWQSDAYQKYIRTPPSELAKFSSLLASASSSIQKQTNSTQLKITVIYMYNHIRICLICTQVNNHYTHSITSEPIITVYMSKHSNSNSKLQCIQESASESLG